MSSNSLERVSPRHFQGEFQAGGKTFPLHLEELPIEPQPADRGKVFGLLEFEAAVSEIVEKEWSAWRQSLAEVPALTEAEVVIRRVAARNAARVAILPRICRFEAGETRPTQDEWAAMAYSAQVWILQKQQELNKASDLLGELEALTEWVVRQAKTISAPEPSPSIAPSGAGP